MEKPSFKSSPWIRGAPHRVFSRDIRRTRWRISLDTGGRPGFLRRDFHVQKSLNPLRCQPMTVSGLTITRAWRQPGHRQDRMTQKTLSAFRSDGRGLCRFRTATCCRRARISVWSAARSAKISMILCMPERVSGGDAKFQGFCHRWNKWEGQLAFFAGLPSCLVGMEACASAHYWARELQAHGHKVQLIPPQYVRPFVKTNKNDAADAEAICEAVTRPTMRFAPAKSAEQQSVLMLHRARELLVRQRTMVINALRGHCAEFGRCCQLNEGRSQLNV